MKKEEMKKTKPGFWNFLLSPLPSFISDFVIRISDLKRSAGFGFEAQRLKCIFLLDDRIVHFLR
jgi:hypothetical protein